MQSTIQQLADRLRQANLTKNFCEPLREVIGVEDIETAYTIQKININRAVAEGARIIGHKIGLTSKAIQKQLGVNQPDFGTLLDSMEILNNDSFSVKELMQPKIEAEIAFVLKYDLPNYPLAMNELISAIDYVLPALEIVGSRIADWNIRITDTIADNASASHFVVGHQPVRLADVDVVNCEMRMLQNGIEASKGIGSACLGSPLNSTLWLVNIMAKNGTPLKADSLILSGAPGKMANVKAGDTFEASFDDWGKVSVHFTG